MRLAMMTLTTVMATSMALATVAQAQEMYTDPDKCVAEVGKLDVDGDGYVDNNEYSAYGRIETNVDTDKDGKISGDEKVVACKGGAMQALKPNKS
ncbi:MAG: hypothetical protein KJ587_08700 [Alphaproteobacteria bacterium]|nr:hypothetical protein [Alphaproteobacteria bacterium]